MSRLVGLIDASDAGGVGGDGNWKLVFHLAAWRAPGEAVERGERRCELPVSDAALTRWMMRLRPYQVVSLDVAKVARGCTVVRKILRAGVKDAELERVATELRAPVKLKTKRFGTLALDRRYGWYEGNARWSGAKVKLTLSTHEDALATAEALFSAEKRWAKQVGEFTVGKLLELKNDVWLEEGEKEVTKQQFLSRLKLRSIVIDEGGRFTFWFGDGDLFWGHAIEVYGTIKAGLEDATIAG